MHIRRRKIQISPPLGDHNHSKDNQIPNRSLLPQSLPQISIIQGRIQKILERLAPSMVTYRKEGVHYVKLCKCEQSWCPNPLDAPSRSATVA